MPIFRFSAQPCEGLVLHDDPVRAVEIIGGQDRAPLAEIMGKAVVDFGLRFEACRPGTYNITPAYWQTNRLDYQLRVMPDCESAEVHLLKKNEAARLLVFKNLGEVATGPQLLRMPGDTALFPVTGPIRGDGRLRLHELIIYKPRKP